MTTQIGTEPTQVRHPRRATFRTIIQTAIPLILALPVAWAIVTDELAKAGVQVPPAVAVWAGVVVAIITTVSAVLARIMAIPAVEAWLRTIPWLPIAAQPTPLPPTAGPDDPDTTKEA